MKFGDLSALEIREVIKKREISAAEVMRATISEIEARDQTINAYITVLKDRAIQKAEEIDIRINKDEPVGPLAGIPIAIKDNICVKNVPTTCGSKILENYESTFDATVVEKINAADGIVIGKSNLDEFAMGSSTETSFFGSTKNPHNPNCVPGGSSGGSTAAVASGEAYLALGSDTGGSIRQPASFCGVVGLKPTYGRISRFGLIAYASSLDQIGPIGKNVKDTSLLFDVISGYDNRDSTSVKIVKDDYANLEMSDNMLKSIKIGIPTEYFSYGMNEKVQEAVENCIGEIEHNGGECVEISLPHTQYAIAAYYIIASAEASSNLERYDGVKYGFRNSENDQLEEMYCKTRTEGFGSEVKRRIMLGTYALSSGYYDAYYLKALKVRNLIRQDFDNAFKKCDCIVTAVAPTPAFKIKEKLDDPLTMYMSDIFTISCNLAGIPGISLPCGSDDGLPIGLQIYGRAFDEQTIFTLANWVEQNVTKV